MSTPPPRRCSKKWLDGDCPKGVLAIMDYGPNEPAERYTVFYAETMQDGRDTWVTYLSTDEDGRYSHGELKAHELAAYRYRKKHRYTRWSDLPDAVKNVVRRDLEVAR